MRLAARLLRRFLAPAIALSTALFTVAPASAVDVTLQVFSDGVYVGESDETRLGCTDNPDGVTAECSQPGTLDYGFDYPLVQIEDITLDLDTDPFVTGTMTVTNATALTQQITLLFNLPVPGIPGSTLHNGSIEGRLLDSLGDGALLTTVPGSAFYTALIDNLNTQALYVDPQVWSVAAAAFPPFTTIAGQSFGPLVGPAVSNVGGSIGIRIDFILSPFDRVAFTSVHNVVVPEPSTGALLAVGFALLAMRRRR